MSKTINFTLDLQKIRKTVINETYHRGEVVRAAGEANTKLGYVQQADTNAYHIELLNRNLFAAVEEFKNHIADFLSVDTQETYITTTYSESADTMAFSIIVPERYDKTYAPTLARVTMKFIEDYMIVVWYADSDVDMSKTWQNFLASDIIAINRCFHKKAPSARGDYASTDVTITTTTKEYDIWHRLSK